MSKDFEMYIGKRVWCKSEYFAEAFLRLAHDNGWEWINGESLLERTYWEVYEKYTCYYVGEDKEITVNTIRQHKPYYINEFIEYDPLCTDKDVLQKELKETLVKYYKVTVELDGITEEYEWWREPENIHRVEKLTKDRDKLVEKINKMLLKEIEND